MRSLLVVIHASVAPHKLEVWEFGDVDGNPPKAPAPRRIFVARCSPGTDEHPTPLGVYALRVKARNPDWQKPNAEWVAPEERGKVVKGGTIENPLKVTFLALNSLGDDPTGVIGIHGTADIEHLGAKASHGCVRVSPEHARKLHTLLPTGCPVHIV